MHVVINDVVRTRGIFNSKTLLKYRCDPQQTVATDKRAYTLFKLLSIRRETLKMSEQEKGFPYDKTQYRLPHTEHIIHVCIKTTKFYEVNAIIEISSSERKSLRYAYLI